MMMNNQMLKEIAVKCMKDAAAASSGAFLLAGVNQDVTGMGDGATLVWRGADGKWKMRRLPMVNGDATMEDGVVIIGDEDLYEDEPDGNEAEEEKAEAADCRVEYSCSGVSVRFFAHVNRTCDGLRILEDFVTMERQDGTREIPVIYWNTGKAPVKTDGHAVRPGSYFISLPNDKNRVARRALKREQDECLTALVKRISEKQLQERLQMVQDQIQEMEPEWTPAQCRKAAGMFLHRERNT